MLIDIAINLLTAFLTIVEGILPPWELNSIYMQNIEWLIDKLSQFNYLIPIATIINSLLLIMFFELSLLVARILSGVISILRGGGKIDV